MLNYYYKREVCSISILISVVGVIVLKEFVNIPILAVGGTVELCHSLEIRIYHGDC